MAKILFIEDEIGRNWRVTGVLKDMKKLGHEVETACSGNEAIEKLENSRFEGILLSIMLPHGSGKKIPKEIKEIRMGIYILERLTNGDFEERGTNRDVPVVVYSAVRDGCDVKRIKTMLRNEEWYFFKPRDPSVVAGVVDTILKEDERGVGYRKEIR